MKIAYLYRNNSSKFDGVNKKVLNTVIEWRKLGIDAKIFVLINKEENNLEKFKYHSNIVEVIMFKSMTDFIKNKSLLNIINQWEPNAIYVRGLDIFFSPAARNLLHSNKVIQEIHTNDLTERKQILKQSIKGMHLSKIITNSFYLMFRSYFLKKVSGAVLLNNELKQILPQNTPRTVVGDGIQLNKGIFPISKVSYKLSDFNIVFMGTQKHPWYGLEKIVKIANYNPDFKFHIVGLNEHDFKEYNVKNNNIFFYGFLDAQSYQSILQKSDVALGSLSLYENNMSEGSPLKGREYLSFGLPCIIGYKDTDFFENCPDFLLELPSTPNNVDDNLDKIRHFILKSKTIVIDFEDIRHLDYSIKEKKRINFIKELIY